VKIISTGIPDIKGKKINEQKIDLANQVIKYTLPLVKKDHFDKINKIKTLQKIVVAKRKDVLREKRSIEKISKEIIRKQKAKLLLDRISKLVLLNLIDEKNRQTINGIIKNISTLSTEEIDNHISNTVKILFEKISISEKSNTKPINS
jgi:hypothetical protein